MNLSVKAILARFNGDVTAAMNYCSDLAAEYPRLHREYMTYFNELLSLSGSRV